MYSALWLLIFLFLFWINVFTVSMVNNMVNDIEISMVYLEVQWT
jgi:hypothetical protein